MVGRVLIMDVSTADHSRRHDFKRIHDGGEEEEGKEYNEFHGLRRKGYSLGERWVEETRKPRVFI